VKLRRLGRTDLQVSAISLGTVEIGMDYGIPTAGDASRPSEADASRLLNQALDWGINFIDTARVYGVSENIIGRALSSRRDEFLIASKIDSSSHIGEEGRALRDGVERSVKESLDALQTDRIDLMYVHDTSLEVIRRGEVVEALKSLQKSGCIRFVGASVSYEEEALAALADGRFDCIQIAYNLLDRSPEWRVLPIAQEKDVGVVVRSVLLKGVLTRRYRFLPDTLGELKSSVERICTLTHASPEDLPELAYRFVLANPCISTALVGTGRLAELQEVIKYAGAGPLDDEAIQHISEITIKNRDLLLPWNWPI